MIISLLLIVMQHMVFLLQEVQSLEQEAIHLVEVDFHQVAEEEVPSVEAEAGGGFR